MSKSIKEIVEIFNQKNASDKNAIQKGKTNDNIGSKIAKSYNSKINENKNIEKSKTNNNNSKIEKEKEKEKEFIKTRKRKETVLLHVVPENPQIPQEKSIISDVISKLKNNMPASINIIQSEKEKESMTKLEILDDAFNFNENDFKKRRYDRDNVEKSGKKFFKLRYLKNKLELNNSKTEKNKGNLNLEKNEDSQLNLDKEKILRKYNSEFILIVEKSILSFNVKNFKESYEVLKNSDIIKNEKEYGEFLLVVSGFDKFLIGEFLAKQKFPNDKKEVLNSFIESINMKMNEISFLDCLRFLFTRLNLPKDANMILEIMDKFSVNFFEVNKNDQSFVDTFKSSDKIYLLVSTILALNTMFTRKDIKNKNVIKKDEFIKMNADITKEYIEKLYDDLKKNPISMTDDYNELMYKKLASLVGKNDKNETEEKSSKISKNNLGGRISNISTEEKIDDNNFNSHNKTNEKFIKTPNDWEQLDDDEEIEDNNQESLKEEDKIILNTPQKLYKLKGTKKSTLREYVFSDDLSKIYYLKKPKKILYVSKLEEVYNGSEHSHNSDIIKYLKNNPSEEPFKGNFISLIFENDHLDLMSDNLDSALKWYKSIKNLISINKKSNKNIKKAGIAMQFETEIKEMTKQIWEGLLNKWNVYGNFLIIKLMERNQFEVNISKYTISSESIKKLTYKNIKNYLKSIDSKLYKDKEIEYSDFINLYYIGLPVKIRKSIWKILIGNPCGIIPTTYEQILKKIPKFNFKSIDFKYPENKNYTSDNLSNQIINEIIEVNDIFLLEETNKNLDKVETMNKVYNIARGFWTFRPDIPFNKSLITIIYLLIFVFEEEADTFCNIVNLICSNILSIFVGDDNEIKIYSAFFNNLLETYLPKIYNQFKKLEITPELYMIPWFEELFTKTLNINILYHIFDLFLLNGEYILFQTSLAIIKSMEDELQNLTINEIFKALQKFSENISETYFMYTLNNFPNIKKEVSKWKSQNYLAKQKSNLFEVIFTSK